MDTYPEYHLYYQMLCWFAQVKHFQEESDLKYIETGKMTVIKGLTHQENTNLNMYAHINIPIPQRRLHEAKFQTISKCYRK